MEQVFLNYAKEGVFLALFLYLLMWNIPRIKQEFKHEMSNMESRHRSEIERVEKKYQTEMEKLEKQAENREAELIRLLNMFEGKFEIINDKVDEVIYRLRDK
jgi:hypothetical protein